MAGILLWGWYATGKEWLKLQVSEEGYVLVDMSDIDGGVATKSTANKTIYVDKAATGTGDGTSWADAFTTIQDAVDSVEAIITHAYTIRVRKGATPYREQVELNSLPASYPSHLILGSLTIEAEYYWYGTCEANVGGAGEITDTAAFADVLVGDKVYILDRNGANNRAQDYELCTVDDISNIPNRIGTDGTKTPTTLWSYVIVRTEISGSDDGTDVGTARDHCFSGTTIDNINIYGFYLTFSDDRVITITNSRNWEIISIIAGACDDGIWVNNLSELYTRYVCIGDNPIYGLVAIFNSSVFGAYYAFVNASTACTHSGYLSYLRLDNSYIAAGTRGLYCRHLAMGYFYLCTISNAVTLGVLVNYNSSCQLLATTNSAVTPEEPVGTVEGAYIG